MRGDDGREWFLHSRVDPVEEGAFLAAAVATQERTLYVVLGFGLGYHVRALLSHIPASSQVLVVEPHTALLSAHAANEASLRLSRWINDPRLHFLILHDPRLLPLHLADRLVSLRLLSMTLVPHIPSMQTAEPFYWTAAQEVRRAFPASIQRHLLMIEQSLDNDLRNFWANLGSSWRAGEIERLAGAWAERPAVIVSSGPSLGPSLPQLAQRAADALVISTGSAAAVLLAHGIRPDAVVAVDPYLENLSHFEGWDTRDIPLVHYQRVYRKVLEIYVGPRLPFVMRDEPPLPLRPSRPSPFHRGGTVAVSALQLAHFLGANPIVFVGQDLAFAEGRTHTQGAVHGQTFDPKALPDGYIEVEGAGGGTVITSEIFHGFLLHMQDYVMNVSRQRPQLRHINTALAGARVRGMEYVELSQVLASLPPLAAAAKEPLRRLLFEPVPVDPAKAREAIVVWTGAARALLDAHGYAEHFPTLFAAFQQTPIYSEVGKGYDDLRYLYDARNMSATPGADAAMCRLFRQHLRQIVADLLSITVD